MICGSGKLDAYLKEEVKKLGIEDKVLFAGFRSDVIELMDSADLFCFPSLQEGLPVALMEAMAVGMPCIASKIRGNVDLLPEKNLFDLHDEGMLIEKIEKAANGQLQTANDNAMVAKCDKDAIDEKMLQIYQLMGHIRSIR